MLRHVAVTFIACSVSVAFAGINETFSYPDGPLTQVSGGKWDLWDPSYSTDPNVSNGSVILNGRDDPIAQFPNELQIPGETVAYSFDILPIENGLKDQMQHGISFVPASKPYLTGTNYNDSLGIYIAHWGDRHGGYASVYIDPNRQLRPLTAGSITIGSWHTISGLMTKRADRIDFTVNIDGVLVGSLNFLHSDPRGINSIEMFELTTFASSGARIDNIRMYAVPEPASLIALGIACLGLSAKRRHSKNKPSEPN